MTDQVCTDVFASGADICGPGVHPFRKELYLVSLGPLGFVYPNGLGPGRCGLSTVN